MSSEEVSNKLSEIDLSGVAFSATVALDPTQPDGKLGPVGDTYKKLRAAAQSSGIARIHTVVLAEEHRQQVKDAKLVSQREAPNIYRDPNADFRVILAKTVDEAIELLYQHVGPRGRIRRHEIEDTEELPVLNRRVSIELYKELPLMRRIEPEELPRESSGPDDAESSFGRQRKKPTFLGRRKIRRWEERMHRQTAERYEPVKLQAAFNDFRRVAPKAASDVPRFVVTGKPGSGKTTLGQYVAREMATGAWSVGGRTLTPFRVSLRDWERWAIDKRDFVLASYLTRRCYDRGLFETSRMIEPDARQLWRDWLRRGDVLLLLDGLDELTGNDPDFNNAVEYALSKGDLRDCPVMLTCRTLSFGQHQALCENMPVFVLDGLRPEQQDAYIRQFPVEERFHAQALIDQLDASPAMRLLAANPLLLSIICFVVDDPQGVRLPATRADLYDKAINKLLIRPDRPSRSDSLPLSRLRGLIEYAALSLFSDPNMANRLTFEEETLLHALDAAGKTSATFYKDAAPSDEVLARATACGLLIGGPDNGYAFLHPTIQEFLVASVLARIINEPTGGWNTKVSIGSNSYSITDVIDHKAWDPAWHEVVLLLAGRLNDPTPLLEMLCKKKPTRTNPHGDDYFRHRLALAAECLPEIPEEHWQKTLADRITTEVYSLWWKHTRRGCKVVVEHLAQEMPALVTVNGRADGIYVLDRLIEATHDEDSDARPAAAVEMIGEIGNKAARPDIRERLLELMNEEVHLLRKAAAEAIVNIYIAAVPSDILDGLLALLHDDNSDVRLDAADTIGELGSTAARDDIIDRLFELLHGDDYHVSKNAAEAIGALGSAEALPDILNRLLAFLYDEDASVRMRATESIGGLGSAAARVDILDGLLELLQDEDTNVRYYAYTAIGKLCSTAEWPDILDRLFNLLDNDNPDVRRAAALALGGLPSAARRTDILNRLLELLQNEDLNVRDDAARAIGALGSAASLPDLIDVLFQLLYDEDPEVRKDAAFALGLMGSAAVRDDILDGLSALLRDEDLFVSLESASAVGRLGSSAARDHILDGMVAWLLHHEESLYRENVIEVIGRLGIGAARYDILDLVFEFLNDNNEECAVREAASRTVGKLGSNAARHDIIDCLLALLDDNDSDVCSGAAEAIAELGKTAELDYIIDGLHALLHDGDSWVRRYVAESIGKLGSIAARDNIIGSLHALLHDEDDSVRRYAVEAIERLGNAAASPDILEVILPLEDSSIKRESAQALYSFQQELRIFRRSHSNCFAETIVKLAALDTPPAA